MILVKVEATLIHDEMLFIANLKACKDEDMKCIAQYVNRNADVCSVLRNSVYSVHILNALKKEGLI